MNTKTNTPVEPVTEPGSLGTLNTTSMNPKMSVSSALFAMESDGSEGDAEDEKMYKELEEIQRKCPHKNFSWEDGCYDCGWYSK